MNKQRFYWARILLMVKSFVFILSRVLFSMNHDAFGFVTKQNFGMSGVEPAIRTQLFRPS